MNGKWLFHFPHCKTKPLKKKVSMPAKKKNIPLRRYLTKPKFHCDIKIEDSSWIDIIQYDPLSKILEAHLRSGNRYRYRNVSALMFAKVITAKSSGKAFNKYIKPRAYANLTKFNKVI